jgi:hypothetical protein
LTHGNQKQKSALANDESASFDIWLHEKDMNLRPLRQDFHWPQRHLWHCAKKPKAWAAEISLSYGQARISLAASTSGQNY